MLTPFATLCYIPPVASYFTRKDSPFYWIRFRRADGTWGQRSSKVRGADKGALRKIHHMVAQETSSEALTGGDGSEALLDRWVPGWIKYKYVNAGTRTRMEYSWSSLSTFLKLRKIQHPQEVTYGLCHDYVKWRTSETNACSNTAGVELKTLGCVIQESVRRGWCLFNPCHKLGIGKERAKQKRAITKDEEQTIFKELMRTGIACGR